MTVFFSRSLLRLRFLVQIAVVGGFTGLLSGCGVSQTAISSSTATVSSSSAAGGPGLTFSGSYTPNTPYGATDVVSYQGSAYVALTVSMNVPPVGNSASAADWALLVAAGQNGATGPAGPSGAAGARGPAGSAGPVGATGLAGATGPAGAPGLRGATGPPGAVGATGAAGAPGISGTMGPAGPSGPTGANGLPGATGPMGPVGATGPVGPAGGSGLSQPVSALFGRGIGVLGDSISAANMWQPVVTSRTGATLSFQDARPGRAFWDAFECYGAPSAGMALGTFQSAGNALCYAYSEVSTVGNTLAQNLATTDMLLIRLGTNDQNIPLGSLGDATNAGTFYGNMRWVVETLLTAKPTLRVILITPELNHFASVKSIQNVVDAEIAYANSMGLPVLDLYRTSGNNALTNSVYTYDGTHPTNWAYQNVDGPTIAQFVLRWF